MQRSRNYQRGSPPPLYHGHQNQRAAEEDRRRSSDLREQLHRTRAELQQAHHHLHVIDLQLDQLNLDRQRNRQPVPPHFARLPEYYLPRNTEDHHLLQRLFQYAISQQLLHPVYQADGQFDEAAATEMLLDVLYDAASNNIFESGMQEWTKGLAQTVHQSPGYS